MFLCNIIRISLSLSQTCIALFKYDQTFLFVSTYFNHFNTPINFRLSCRMKFTQYQYSILLLSYYLDGIQVTIGGEVKSFNGVIIDLMTRWGYNRLDDSTLLEETLEPKDNFQDTSNKYLTRKKRIDMSILQCKWVGRYYYSYRCSPR